MKKFFLDNLGLKIAAFLLSVVLWVFVTSRGQSEMSLDVPLEFKNVPSGLELVNRNIKTVSVIIKGQERFIKNVRPSDVRVSLDMSKAKKGEGVYYIHRDDVVLPHALTVTDITPSSVKVSIEETATKTVRVVALVTGEPEKGYRIKSVEVVPQTVLIEGIRSEVSRIKTVRTEPLDVTGLSETFTQDLKLDLGKNVRSKVGEVTTTVTIVRSNR